MCGTEDVERSHEATIVAAWCVLVADDEPVCCVLGYATDGWGGVESVHKFAQGVGARGAEMEVGAQVDKLSGTHGVRSLDGEVGGEAFDTFRYVGRDVGLLADVLVAPLQVAECHGACQCHGVPTCSVALDKNLR